MKLFSRYTKALFVLTPVIFLVSAACADTNLPSVKLDLKVAYPQLSFTLPVWMTEPADGTKRQFLVEQEGRIWILPKDRNSSEPQLFLDISDRKPHRQLEEGLLCLAFHPQYKTNGKFYLFYTQQGPKRNVLSEFQVSKTDPNKADLATERVILEVAKPYWNHNGSTLMFGPDGYLYFSTGDGGGGYDPNLTAQNDHNVLGKIHRIDINSRAGKLPYGIPKDNPFIAKDKQGNLKADPFDTSAQGVRPEIWALGLRNVWRMSFDRETGELWVGDVGQDKWEEVDLITKGGNYGWSVREGFHSVDRPINKAQKPLGETIDPIIEYAHKESFVPDCKFPEHGLGVSITGGYVYRGKKFPALRGTYVYADFQMGTIWGLRYDKGQITQRGVIVPQNLARQIPTFAEDSDGELYVISFDGKIYEFVEAK